MNFSIVHTTIRYTKWQQSAKTWLTLASSIHDVEYILSVDDPNYKLKETDPWPVHLVYTDLSTGLDGCVRGYNSGAKHATGKIILLNSDDMFPPKNWDKLIYDKVYDKLNEDFILKVNDGNPNVATFQIMSKVRYDRLGYALNPLYHSLYADTEFTKHAKLEGKLIEAPEIKIEHRHPCFGFPWDEVYEKENNSNFLVHGMNLFNERLKQGFK